jgi:hypothetical protein
LTPALYKQESKQTKIVPYIGGKRPLVADDTFDSSPDTKMLKVKEEIFDDDDIDEDMEHYQEPLVVIQEQDPMDRVSIEQYVDHLVELQEVQQDKKTSWKDFLAFRGKEKLECQPTKQEFLSFFEYLRHALNYKGGSMNVRYSRYYSLKI